MNDIDSLYALEEILANTLSEAVEKIDKAGSKLSPSDLEYVDKLTHAYKSVKASIAMCEASEGGGSAFDDGGGSYQNSMNSRRSYSRYGNSRNGSYNNSRRSRRSYARNGGGYSGHDFVMSLKDALESAPDDQSRQQIEQLIQEMGQR